MKHYEFSKKYRLLNKGDYSRVFNHGKVIKSKNRLFKVFYFENSLNFPRLGLAIAKKNNPKANQRNRLKRQLRETFRRYKNRIHHYDLVVLSLDGKGYSNQNISASFIECLNLINNEKIIFVDD